MEVKQITLQLHAALDAAQTSSYEDLTMRLDYIRDASYEISARHAAYLIREACQLIERVPTAVEPVKATSVSKGAILRIEAAVSQVKGQVA